MKNNRREILKAGLLGGIVSATGLPLTTLAANEERNPRQMNILVLGGTGFIGPHMVREALRRGHNVTLFNRGRTNNKLFPDLETIKGDRAGDLEGLEGRRWDAVVDNSGYMPQHVRHSASLLSDYIGHYIFISTISVYESYALPNNEESALATIEDVPEEFSWDNYGALKVLCERWAAEEIGDDRFTVMRPTYICGPGDHTDRFTYWPVRTKKGGQMLWPSSASHPTQIVDVRDLAIFVVDCLEQKTIGTYNTVTPVGSYTFGNLLEDSQTVTGSNVDPVWIDDMFLASADIRGELPIYHPVSGEYAHVSSISGERAHKAGLRSRPIRETVRDLMAWWETLSEERIANARFEMTPEREVELIAKWLSTKKPA